MNWIIYVKIMQRICGKYTENTICVSNKEFEIIFRVGYTFRKKLWARLPKKGKRMQYTTTTKHTII